MTSETPSFGRPLGEAVVGTLFTLVGVFLLLRIEMSFGQIVGATVGTSLVALWAGLSIKDCIMGPPSD